MVTLFPLSRAEASVVDRPQWWWASASYFHWSEPQNPLLHHRVLTRLTVGTWHTASQQGSLQCCGEPASLQPLPLPSTLINSIFIPDLMFPSCSERTYLGYLLLPARNFVKDIQTERGAPVNSGTRVHPLPG